LKKTLISILFSVLPLFAAAQTNCTVNPGACQTPPIPSTCPTGQHWTNIGSPVAHCVADDPPCVNGTVSHDSQGNPISCVPNAPTVTSTYPDGRTLGCSAGYSGYREQERTCSVWSDGHTSCGGFVTVDDQCTANAAAPPPPPPPAPTPTCSNGAADYPTCTPPSGPTPPPPPAPTPTPTCSNGAADYPTCTPPAPPTCANGANNYPLCTFAATPPPPPTCPDTVVQCGFEQKSVIVWTIYTTTYSGPNCTAKTTTTGPYYDWAPGCD
jgi:hypothetical protein